MNKYVFFLVLPVFVASVDMLQAVDCPPSESGTHEVICGPDSDNGQTIWNDEQKQLSKLDIIQGTLTINNNSRITFSAGSSINLDGGGCLDDECDPSNPADDTYGRNILEVFGSELFHGNSQDDFVNMKDVNVIRAQEQAKVTLGTIRDQDNYAQIELINVADSDLSITKIDFVNSNSFLREFKVVNEEKNRGLYNTTINQGIRVSKIQSMIFENADVVLDGDIVAYGSDSTTDAGGSVGNINLRNADLFLKGNKITTATSFALYNGAVFKADPTVGNHVIRMGMGSPIILVNQGSEFIAKEMEMIVDELNIVAKDADSKVNIDKIYYTDEAKGTQRISLEIQGGSSINIGEFDTRVPGINAPAYSTMVLNGDKDSSYEIGKLIVDNEAFEISFINAHGTIDTMEYHSPNVILESNNKSSRPFMNINHINILSPELIKKIDIIQQNTKIGDVVISTDTDVLDIILQSSTIEMASLYCTENCNIVNFTGTLLESTEEEKPYLELENFNNGTTSVAEGQNNFDGIHLNVLNNYSGDGTFDVKDSKLSFVSLNGIYTHMNLTDNSKVEILDESDIFLTGELITIDGSSELSIHAKDVFDNARDITIDNDGILRILDKNNIKTINNNSETAIAILDGGSLIDNITNDGTLELHNDNSITNLVNNNVVLIYGTNYVENLTSTADSNLTFVVSHRYADPSLIIEEMKDPYEGSLDFYLHSTAHLRPGLINRYNLLQTRKGALNIDSSKYEEMFDVMPPWLIYEQNVDFNNGENAIDGETAWINIQRLTNYTNLINAIPERRNDKTLMEIARAIDSVILDSFVTRGLEDVVNSLDFASGCSADEELLYLAHQGVIDLDISQAPCLYTMADNMTTLQPVSNELYFLYTHMETMKAIDNLTRENRNYIYTQDIYNWYNFDFGYTSMPSKDTQSGMSSFNSSLNVGISFSPISNYNFSGLLGVGIGTFNAKKDTFDGYNNSILFGLAGSYLRNSYYFSLSAATGLTYFYIDRAMDFLDNEFSTDKGKVSESNVPIFDATIKAEVGKEIIANTILFFIPKAFISESFIRNDSYKEFGNSGSLVVAGDHLFITDVGIGIQGYTELFITGFLSSEPAFIYPKLGMNIIGRFYPDKGTDSKFLGTTDNYNFTSEWAHYSGVLTQLQASLEYQESQVSFGASYDLDIALAGYYNHNLSLQLKYMF